MSAAKVLAIILTCFALQDQVHSAGVPANVLNVLTNYNGIWDNSAQLKNNRSEHTWIRIRYIPVKVPALSDAPVLFTEISEDGVIVVFHVGVVTEDNNKVLHVTPYTFTDQSKYRPGEFNVTDLANLTMDDFTTNEECIITLEPMEPNIFVAAWPSCSTKLNGKRPLYSLTYGCDKIIAILPIGARAVVTNTPYIFLRDGDRFPMPDTPEDFIPQCRDE